MFNLIRAMIVLVTCLVFLGRADADQTWLTVRHRSMGWTFATAVSEDQVVGFLGWESDGQTVLGNIKVMWFQRDQAGLWNAWAWSDNDLGVAVNSVRTMLGDPLVFSHDTDLANLAQLAVDQGYSEPSAVINGLYADDALQSIIANDPHADALVEMLASVGWPVGQTLSAELAKADKDCQGVLVSPLNATMNTFARGSEIALLGESTTNDPCADMFCVGCQDRETRTPGAWTLVRSTLRSVGGYKCEWSRTVTVTYQGIGRTYWACNSCTAAAPTTQTETKTTYSAPGDGCTTVTPEE